MLSRTIVVHAGSAPPRSAEASAATPSSAIWFSLRSSISKLGIAPSSRSAARAAAAPSPIWLSPRSSISSFRSPPPACAARSASHSVSTCASSHPRLAYQSATTAAISSAKAQP